MIDHELDRLKRVDAIGVAAQADAPVAHRRQIDHARDAGEILQQHACGRERDFLLKLRAGLPSRQRLDVVRAHEALVFMAQQILEQHLQ